MDPNRTNNCSGRQIRWTNVFVGLSVLIQHDFVEIALAYHDGHFNLDYMTKRFSFEYVRFREIRCDPLVGPEADIPIQDDEQDLPEPLSYSPYLLPSSSEPPLDAVFKLDPNGADRLAQHIVQWLHGYACKHGFKIVGAGIDHPTWSILPQLPNYLWIQMDILPFHFHLEAEFLDERADSASRKCAAFFGYTLVPRVTIGFRNEVIVDSRYIQFARLEDYEKTVSQRTWTVLLDLAQNVRHRALRVAFFNATPQGGGVALMRHALLRLLHLLKIDATWHVPKPNNSVFRITKNMHNILQGVANDKEVSFAEDDIKQYEHWVRINCMRYWMDGPFKTADVIVLDDPQVSGYIPYIREVNENCIIVYRSHIEIASDLADDPSTIQHKVWKYIWRYIQQADIFISHPIPKFVPQEVPEEKVVFLPASTDPLDGLSKPQSPDMVHYYQQMLTRLSLDQNGDRLQFVHRPYVIQIARFDPSKGIDDVIESYRLLRERMDPVYALRRIPQLVICGHGSVDDADGTIIYEHVIKLLQGDQYETFRHDILVVRLPPIDTLLNALLRGARVALQLSCREGFEVKVTEALHKGIPVIAYRTGGIPLQLENGRGGYLVPVGDTQQVAQLLFDLCRNDELHASMSRMARASVTEEYWTVWQCVNWLWIFHRLAGQKSPQSFTNTWLLINGGVDTDSEDCASGYFCHKWVKNMWKAHYQKLYNWDDKWGDRMTFYNDHAMPKCLQLSDT